MNRNCIKKCVAFTLACALIGSSAIVSNNDTDVNGFNAISTVSAAGQTLIFDHDTKISPLFNCNSVDNILVEKSYLDEKAYTNSVIELIKKCPNLSRINYVELSKLEDTDFYDDVLCKIAASMNYEDSNSISSVMIKRVKRIADKIKGKYRYYDEFGKVTSAYDFILNKVDYGSVGDSCGWRRCTDWSVFCNPDKLANCDGHARAFLILTRELGLESYYEGFKSHAANIVKVNGKYYHVDISDDQVGWHNFLLSDKEFRINSEGNPNTHHIFPSGENVGDDEVSVNFGSGRYVIRVVKVAEKRNYYTKSSVSKSIRCTNVLGDINRDGKFNDNDIMTLKKYILGDIAISNVLDLADFNNDEKISSADLVRLMNLKKYRF